MSKQQLHQQKNQDLIEDAAPYDVVEEQAEWDLPFSEAQVAAWKEKYGDGRIHLATHNSDMYVIRSLSRAEFQEISKRDFKNEDELENTYVHETLLYPELTLVALREKPGGLIPSLFEKLMEVSNVQGERPYIPQEFKVDGPIPEPVQALIKTADITAKDLAQWIGMNKKIYVEITEGKLFFYKGLRRSDFEKYKDAHRKGEFYGPGSEEEMVRRGVIYPYNIEPLSDTYLHGTITTLSNLVYAASGFNANTSVRAL